MPTKTDIWNKFLTDVANPVRSAYGITYYQGSLPSQGMAPVVFPNSGDFDPSNADISDAALQATFDTLLPNTERITARVFNVLHCVAMKLTKVRPAVNYYTVGSYIITANNTGNRVNVKNGFELYFDPPAIPNNVTGVGATPLTPISLTDFNAFFTALQAAVVTRRTDAANFGYPSLSTSPAWCHSSCHGSCHGSRGRR